MVAACHDHVAGWADLQASDHFPNKIHLPSRNHFSYTKDGVKHAVHLIIVQTLFLHLCHQDPEDTLNAVVKKHFQFIEL
jgi:hypothetical protein